MIGTFESSSLLPNFDDFLSSAVNLVRIQSVKHVRIQITYSIQFNYLPLA